MLAVFYLMGFHSVAPGHHLGGSGHGYATLRLIAGGVSRDDRSELRVSLFSNHRGSRIPQKACRGSREQGRRWSSGTADLDLPPRVPNRNRERNLPPPSGRPTSSPDSGSLPVTWRDGGIHSIGNSSSRQAFSILLSRRAPFG